MPASKEKTDTLKKLLALMAQAHQASKGEEGVNVMKKTDLITKLNQNFTAEFVTKTIGGALTGLPDEVPDMTESYTALLTQFKAQEDGDVLDVDTLHVREAFVDEGATLRRWRARAMGRASPIRKRTSHITVIVDTKE